MQTIIHAYTRAEALEDGEQIEVSTVAQETGIRFPVFLTRAVYDAYVTVPPEADGQDEAGRLWDILWMARGAMKNSRPGSDRIEFSLRVRNDNFVFQLVKLVAVCGPLDMDRPEPAITIMLRTED